MIELKKVGRVFRTSEVETIALENVNISIEKGEFVAIMGPSGCGKSTLLNIMGLLDRPTEGEVILKGTPTGSLSDRRAAAFRNRTVGFVFQSFHLIPSLNVLQNVEMPLLYCGMSEGKRHERARQLLEQVGMSHRLRHLPSQLSGGHPAGRRAYGQPGLAHECRDYATAAPTEPKGGAHHRYGDSQRGAGPSGRPHHPLLRRAASRVIFPRFRDFDVSIFRCFDITTSNKKE